MALVTLLKPGLYRLSHHIHLLRGHDRWLQGQRPRWAGPGVIRSLVHLPEAKDVLLSLVLLRKTAYSDGDIKLEAGRRASSPGYHDPAIS